MALDVLKSSWLFQESLHGAYGSIIYMSTKVIHAVMLNRRKSEPAEDKVTRAS